MSELKLEPIIADDVVWGKAYYEMHEVDDVIANLKAENDHLRSTTHSERDEYIDMVNARDKEIAELKQKLESVQASMYADVVAAGMENRRLKRALWLMTAEWAEGMGLASCNIAIKLSFKERFFYHDEANREKDIKKYKHRQVVFYKYADYCRAKAEEFK